MTSFSSELFYLKLADCFSDGTSLGPVRLSLKLSDYF